MQGKCSDGERERKGETALDLRVRHVEARLSEPLSDGGVEEQRRRRFAWQLRDERALSAGVWAPRDPIPDQTTRVGASREGRGLCRVGGGGGCAGRVRRRERGVLRAVSGDGGGGGGRGEGGGGGVLGTQEIR